MTRIFYEPDQIADNDMAQDMKDASWFVEKCKQDHYAQNLYAAMCNMRWQRIEVIPILKDEYWSASWRGAGRIVAEIRDSGEDYMDYYCSGILGGMSYDTTEDELRMAEKRYVPEGTVTDEIETDLRQLGWQPSPWPED